MPLLRSTIAISILLTVSPAVSAAAGPPDIWLSGVPPFLRQKMFQESESDYLELFRADAPWSKTSQQIKVFMVNGGLVFRESDAVLQTVFADLKRRHIALAIEMGLVSGKDGAGRQVCGVGVEGFAPPDTAKVFANRIQRNGGELAYVAMDEPLWYAHHFSGKNACNWSMEAVARDIAPRVNDLRAKFPAVQIGDVEPAGTPQPPDWLQEITQWTAVYRSVLGENLGFFHCDVLWTAPWQQQVAAIKRVVQSKGLKFGIIYDGGGTGAPESDELWTREAAERARSVETSPALVPDEGIIQTWARWPHKMLPEDQPDTMTNLALKIMGSR
jgi:hypothetical protein